MSSQRIFSLIVSTALAAILGLFLVKGNISWDGRLEYVAQIILFIFFLGILVSNQQFEEDVIAKIERIVSSILVSFVFFLQLIYVPVARFFFGNLIQKAAFFPDTLALFFFLFFSVIFIIAAVAASSFSKTGFLANWKIFNNQTAYFVLRNLWMAAVLLTIYLYQKDFFLIITV